MEDRVYGTGVRMKKPRRLRLPFGRLDYGIERVLKKDYGQDVVKDGSIDSGTLKDVLKKRPGLQRVLPKEESKK
jgi:hypothetical protein